MLKCTLCRYRLARNILNYPTTNSSATAADDSGRPSKKSKSSSAATAAAQAAQPTDVRHDPDRYVRAVDGALPPAMLGHMQSAFGRDSAFWREHGYDSETSSYFSYVHDLSAAPQSSLDLVSGCLNGVRYCVYTNIHQGQMLCISIEARH